MIHKSVRNLFAALVAVFALTLFTNAQASHFTDQSIGAGTAQAAAAKPDFSSIKIGNFGQMDDRFYRGAQPLESDYQALKDIGINTIIDLRNDPTEYEKKTVEALGMTYVNIPMSGWKSPKQADIDQFLALIEKPDTGKFYVHCKAGIHRTGVIGAAYRYTKYGWDYDNVYKEMKNYNYSNGLVHGALGSFVKEMGKRHAAEAKSASPAISAVLSSPVTASGSDDN